MKKLALISLVLFVVSVFATKAEDYKLNNAEVDALFEQAIEVDFTQSSDLNLGVNGIQAVSDNIKLSDDPDGWVAFALAFVVGQLGIHRIYLGTAPLTFVGYILTAGGCGIVAFVDWIVLLIGAADDDISKYVDNTKFFMWAGN